MPDEIIDTTTVGDITIVHTVKPKKSLTEMYEKQAIPTKIMKWYRETLPYACAFCHKLQKDELVCAKCKVAAYCSKECQKNQWPSHKVMCRNTKAGAKLKLVYTFASNRHALYILLGTFAVAFRLYVKKILDRPMIVRCDLAVDAADMSIIFSLTSGKQTPEDYPDGVEGMVQIKSFIPFYSSGVMNAGQQKIWEQARHPAGEPNTDSMSKAPVGLIDFHLEGTDQVITVPFTIPDDSIKSGQDISRLGGQCVEFLGKHGSIAQDITLPLIIDSSIRSINMSILNDEKNLLRLRTHMPKEALYKYVGSNINREHLEALPTTTTVSRGKEVVRLQSIN